MFNKFCKGFYKFFSSDITRYTILLLFFVVITAITIAQISNVSFLKVLMIEVGFLIGSSFILNISMLIIGFFEDVYDKGKQLIEEKKEANTK